MFSCQPRLGSLLQQQSEEGWVGPQGLRGLGGQAACAALRAPQTSFPVLGGRDRSLHTGLLNILLAEASHVPGPVSPWESDTQGHGHRHGSPYMTWETPQKIPFLLLWKRASFLDPATVS